jgi:hypothetical protein
MLCRGSPEEFTKYLQYCRGLKFDEKPDYNYLRGLWKGLMGKQGWDYDSVYDWVLKKEGKDVPQVSV